MCPRRSSWFSVRSVFFWFAVFLLVEDENRSRLSSSAIHAGARHRARFSEQRSLLIPGSSSRSGRPLTSSCGCSKRIRRWSSVAVYQTSSSDLVLSRWFVGAADLCLICIRLASLLFLWREFRSSFFFSLVRVHRFTCCVSSWLCAIESR